MSGEKFQAVILRNTLIDNVNNSIVEVSCYISQEHNYTQSPTTNFVEDGIDVADHVKQDPKSITLSGITSDYQPTYKDTIDAVKTLIDEDNRPVIPSVDTYTSFRQMFDNSELVIIATRFFTYENMMLTSLKVVENKDNANSIEFTASFIEIRIIENAQTSSTNLVGKYSKASAEASKRAQQLKEAEKKAKKVKKLPKKVKLQSLFSKLLEYLTGA